MLNLFILFQLTMQPNEFLKSIFWVLFDLILSNFRFVHNYIIGILNSCQLILNSNEVRAFIIIFEESNHFLQLCFQLIVVNYALLDRWTFFIQLRKNLPCFIRFVLNLLQKIVHKLSYMGFLFNLGDLSRESLMEW